MHGVLSFFWFLSVSASRFATLTLLLPAWLIGYRLATTFEPTCTTSPPTPLHLPCACCALSSPPQTPSLHPAHSFFVPSRHWTWCFDGSGRLFRAAFVCAGPPQSPLHTCTTTFLALFSFAFCLCTVKWTQLSTPFWVRRSKSSKQGAEPSLLALPHPSPLFAPFSFYICAH
jgi:hypothetical protein